MIFLAIYQKMKLIKVLACVFYLSFLFIQCENKKSKREPKKNIVLSTSKEVNLKDTLKIGYTYWWPQSGPFIGNCGEKYSLVFLGTVDKIYNKTEQPHYTARKGVIRVDEVLTSVELTNSSYHEQNYVISDCFADVDVKEGDSVIVFCYEYEGNYSTPGGKSILKIEDNNDPVVVSIKEYIKSEQNPLTIEKDIPLWKKYQLDTALKQLISCRELYQ